MPITRVEIAQAAGFSVSTASRALSKGNYPLKEETRQRILNLAEEMGYKPNLVARSLQSNRSHLVGVIVYRIQSLFAATTVQGIQDGLRDGGYSISIAYSNRDQEVALDAVHSFYSHQFDGIVILNVWLHHFNDPVFLQSRKVCEHNEINQSYLSQRLRDQPGGFAHFRWFPGTYGSRRLSGRI